jgi:hypothetical protein
LIVEAQEVRCVCGGRLNGLWVAFNPLGLQAAEGHEGVFLGLGPESGFEVGVEFRAVRGSDANEGIAHFVDDAEWVGKLEDVVDSGADGLVVVGNKEGQVIAVRPLVKRSLRKADHESVASLAPRRNPRRWRFPSFVRPMATRSACWVVKVDFRTGR